MFIRSKWTISDLITEVLVHFGRTKTEKPEEMEKLFRQFVLLKFTTWRPNSFLNSIWAFFQVVRGLGITGLKTPTHTNPLARTRVCIRMHIQKYTVA